MNLCERCIIAINKANLEDLPDEGWTPYSLIAKPRPELECEFWAHQLYNKLLAVQPKGKAT